MKKTSWKNPVMLFLTATIWGVAFVAQSVGMEYIGPFTFNFARCLLGCLVLLPCIFFLDKIRSRDVRETHADENTGKFTEANLTNGNNTGCSGKNPAGEGIHDSVGKKSSGIAAFLSGGGDGKTLLKGGICCGIVFFIASNLQQFGIQYTTVGKAGFITALYIVLVPLLGIFVGKAAGLRVWISVALAVAGLYLLCITGGFSIGKGDFLVLLCALAFTIHILVIDYFSPKTDGVRLSCMQFFVCCIFSGIGMLITEKPEITAILQAWMPILYAGVMSCGVAYTLQIVGQKGMDPTVASLIMSLESVISVLAGWALLGQRLSARELAGCALMFTAIVLAQLPGKIRKEKNKHKL